LLATRRLRTRVILAIALAAVVAALAAVVVVRSGDAPVAPQSMTLEGARTSATDPTPVLLDADLYLPEYVAEPASKNSGIDGTSPARSPLPAIVLAHGFGGSKKSVTEQAQALAQAGFVVLAYSARGFGASTGLISMNAPDFEVADASRLIDYLASRPEVRSDGPGDPRVAFAGASYGGALALMAAGYDSRVDAIAADITWNSLEASLFGQSLVERPSSGSAGSSGAFKALWSGLFFSAGQSPSGEPVTECGRFTRAWCEAYTRAAISGTVDPAGAALMRASSPISITDRIAVPTLIGGGQADSLFPLTQADANATQILQAHPTTPVKVVWHAGGHDGGLAPSEAVSEQLSELTIDWFAAHLADGPPVDDSFLFSVTSGSALSDRAASTIEVLSSPTYPGLDGTSSTPVSVSGPRQDVLAPAGGVPAAISSLPGLGGVASLLGEFGATSSGGVEQQSAIFLSRALSTPVSIVGAPRARITISSDRPLEGATVFAALRIVDDQGRSRLPAGLVTPIRLASLDTEPVTLDIELPAIVAEAPAGSRLALTLTTTDQAFRLPAGPAVYSVALANEVVSVPTATGAPEDPSLPAWIWPLAGVAFLLVIALALFLTRPRSQHSATREPASSAPPVVVTALAKEYPGGVRAVSGVDFTVPPGVVLGLLGPNGAGKSTTMRMMMGLITPTGGETRVFGEHVYPGAPILSRIGCFIEGPGLLPHLTGRQNLELLWRASGRTGDAHMEEVLEIAGLGSAIDRRVRTYSQGMRQRVGIAQAMLGLPDLLLLDEPTNGLDPPQIREMRDVMKAYVDAGRTVIVSSHLLSEVEQSCTEVVVMNAGKVIAQGSVDTLLSEHHGRRLEDVFMDLVGEGHEVAT
jgi:ABC-2 type transport system ATP-binding protein